MDKITIKNFRCFRDEQSARLAPLTLLVGENSTGKTSFMAMIRALLDVAHRDEVPDFKKEPYDLGSFDEIAHHRGGRGGRADTFEAGFDATPLRRRRSAATGDGPYRFRITFEKKGTTPVPVQRRLAFRDICIDERAKTGQPYELHVGTPRGRWQRQVPAAGAAQLFIDDSLRMTPFRYSLRYPPRTSASREDSDFAPLAGSPAFNSADLKLLDDLLLGFRFIRRRPFASAPVRSKPRRTYDPSHTTPDPEGDYVPMYLANAFFQNKKTWTSLKERLEGFGKAAGLFDEISIRPLGKKESEPFQVQVRKFAGALKGPRRNLIDVGYGVSQVLPLITELLRRDSPPPMFLLQQPEVHLHPSAQAALGSLFCHVAAPNRQLVIETHSDHLIDRVRMDVRDGQARLKPDDVSILFFERGDLDVRIHSLRIDGDGNIVGAPDSYRNFFMEEAARSLWKRRISVAN